MHLLFRKAQANCRCPSARYRLRVKYHLQSETWGQRTVLDICDSDPKREGGTCEWVLGEAGTWQWLVMDAYRKMYKQQVERFLLGVPFRLRNSCVCVRSCTCLYLYIHSCLYTCGNMYFHFLELEVALPSLFAIALDFFLMLFVSNPFYNPSVPVSHILWQWFPQFK